MRDPLSPAAVGERKVGHFQLVPWELYCLGVKKETGKLSLGLAYLTYFLDYLAYQAWIKWRFKGTPSEKKKSQFARLSLFFQNFHTSRFSKQFAIKKG